MLIEVLSFPTPNPHRSQAPCNVEAHFFRVAPQSEGFTTPILYCPVCGWTYEEIAVDVANRERCTFIDKTVRCHLPRIAGTAKCAQHQGGSPAATPP